MFDRQITPSADDLDRFSAGALAASAAAASPANAPTSQPAAAPAAPQVDVAGHAAAYREAFPGYVSAGGAATQGAVTASIDRPHPVADNDGQASLSDAEIEARRLEADGQIAAKAAVTSVPGQARMDQKLAARLGQMVRSPTYKGGSSPVRAGDAAHQGAVEQLVFFANFTDHASLTRDPNAAPDAQIYAYLNLNHQADGSVQEEWRVFEVVAAESHAYQAQGDGAGTNSGLGLPTSGREQSPAHPEWTWFQNFEGGTLAELAAQPGHVQRYDLTGAAVGAPYVDTHPVDLSLQRRTVMRSDLVPFQYSPGSYTNPAHQNHGYYNAACGCAAFVAFRAAASAPVSLDTACDLAQAQGAWAPEVGWYGAARWASFANDNGLAVSLVAGGLSAEASKAIEDAVQAGRMVTLSTAGHYWVIEGWDEAQQLYYVGNSGRAGPGGSPFMSLAQMAANGGGVNGVIIAR